jgi:hypothetical protein
MADLDTGNPSLQPSTRRGSAKPSAALVAIAVVLLLGSLVILSASFWVLHSMNQRFSSWNQFRMSISTFVNAVFFWLTLLQIAFSLIGIITSIGLLQLRERARKAAVFLSTVPAAILAFTVLTFAGATSETGRGGLVAGYALLLYGAVFLIVLPVSIWWLVVLTRDRVKSQFSGN